MNLNDFVSRTDLSLVNGCALRTASEMSSVILCSVTDAWY